MDFTKILVALDPGGDSQTTVFQRALSLARTENSRLMLLGCLKPRTTGEVEDRVGTMARVDAAASLSARRRHREAAGDHRRAWLESLAEEVRRRGREAEVVVEIGQPGPEICRLAEHWQADVIVLGLTRRGELAERLLGSVAQHVAHHAPCSVLMVHRD